MEEVKKENKVFSSKEVEEIKSEMNDKYIRLLAEFENYKKRSKKEKDDIKSTNTIEVLNSILDLDNDLSISIKQIKNKEAKEGIKLMLSKIEKFLNIYGIKSIQTIKYDADLHEVISIIETGKTKIVDVVSKGYLLNDKPFKYPKIILSK